MSAKNIAKNYKNCARIFFSGREETFLVWLRSSDVDRFYHNIDKNTESLGKMDFFCCETIDGKSLAINLSFIQALHVLWEPSALPEDERRYDGPTRIFLKNRAQPLTTGAGDPENLHDIYAFLENGIDAPNTFVRLINQDGENILFNAEELQVIESPTYLIREGRELLIEGLDIE